uniref:Retrotransposon protein, putative, Ty3-gypsy subclass n=2 Tax=Oryza sativa subsp. japonica TaxID=39947 RepID=Q8SAU8_ORYSJ|nr:Putative polyprotein [Oryza sativa]AAP52412.1 retrotransposon protein, putative, Ty3-gypsy subclass [Oryza sativa Japonica Group]
MEWRGDSTSDSQRRLETAVGGGAWERQYGVNAWQAFVACGSVGGRYHVLVMVKTKNDPRDSNDASGSEEQTDGAHISGVSSSIPSPPPENPTVTHMMTMMMQQMQQHYHQMLQQAQQNQQFGPPPSHLSKLLDFLRI